jgi:amino acid transporter
VTATTGSAQAVAEVEDRQLLKTMRWWDGFIVALANPGFLIASLGFSIGALGAWGAVVIWTVSMLLGALQAWIYSEMALMFPNLSGGIAVYGHQAWKRYSSSVGALTTFGYWFGWSSVLSIFGLLIGTLAQAQYWPHSMWSFDIGLSTFGLPKLIAVLAIILVWVANARGMRVAVLLTYVTGALLLIPLAVVMFGGFITGDFHSSNLSWSLPGGWQGWKLALVWLYLMCWSSYAVETCATFAPEYRDTRKDTVWALRSSSLFNLAVYLFLPLGVVGTLTSKQVADGAGGSYIVENLRAVIGAGSGVATALIIAGLLLAMNTATMDGSRALYGIAQDGMTLKQLGRLNRHNVPGVAMTVDAILNIGLLFLFDSTLGILAAGNLGYVLSHIIALSGFLLLRRDRPDWPRPLRLKAGWLPVAAGLLALNVLFTVVGFIYFADTGYSSGVTWLGVSRELWIGVLILFVGLVLYIYRRVVQDKLPFVWRDLSPDVPHVPDPVPAAAE